MDRNAVPILRGLNLAFGPIPASFWRSIADSETEAAQHEYSCDVARAAQSGKGA